MSSIRLPNGTYADLVIPVGRSGIPVTQVVPVRPDGTLIESGGIASEIISPTKPTTRVGGSALVGGDKWYDTARNIDFYWTGTVWASTQLFVDASPSFNVASSGFTITAINIPNGFDALIQGFRVSARIEGTTNNTNDYWLFYPRLGANTPYPGTPSATTQGLTYAQFANVWQPITYSYLYPISANQNPNGGDWGVVPITIGFSWDKFGSPSDLTALRITTEYRLVP